MEALWLTAFWQLFCSIMFFGAALFFFVAVAVDSKRMKR